MLLAVVYSILKETDWLCQKWLGEEVSAAEMLDKEPGCSFAFARCFPDFSWSVACRSGCMVAYSEMFGFRDVRMIS